MGELNEIKKLKSDVSGLKKEVIGIRQSEEDISKVGMDKLSKINEEFKAEMKMIKSDVKSIKKDIVSVKDSKNKTEGSAVGEDNDPRDGSDTEKSKTSRKRNNSYREPKIPQTILEKINSSDDEGEKEALGKKKLDPEKAVERATEMKAVSLVSAEGSSAVDYPQDFDDDQIRKLVFSSQEPLITTRSPQTITRAMQSVMTK